MTHPHSVLATHPVWSYTLCLDWNFSCLCCVTFCRIRFVLGCMIFVFISSCFGPYFGFGDISFDLLLSMFIKWLNSEGKSKCPFLLLFQGVDEITFFFWIVCMYTHMCICVYIHTFVCACLYMYLCVHTYLHVHAYIPMCVCAHLHVYVCTYA